MSSRATWHSPTRKLREGSSTATFTQDSAEGQCNTWWKWAVGEGGRCNISDLMSLAIFDTAASSCNCKAIKNFNCNSYAQIYKQLFRCHASAASNICNASKVQCNACTAWVLLWLTVNIRHAAKMIRLQHPNDYSLWRKHPSSILGIPSSPICKFSALEPIPKRQ